MSDSEIAKVASLSDEELSNLESYSRMMIACRALNMNEKERQIISQILLDSEPWTIQTLAERINYSRAGVRDALNDLERIEMAERCPDGWYLTNQGLSFFALVFREVEAIGEGKFNSFSPMLERILKSLNLSEMTRPFDVPDGAIFGL